MDKHTHLPVQQHGEDRLRPIHYAFVSIDILIIVVLTAANVSLLGIIGAAIGMALTFLIARLFPYIFISFQHIAVFLTIPFVFKANFGYFPGGLPDVDSLSLAVAFIFLGTGLVAWGIRIGAGNIPGFKLQVSAALTKSLFYIVLSVFSIDWFFRVENNFAGGGLAQVVNEIVKFRYFFFVLLVFAAISRRHGFRYPLLAALFILLPQITSHMSGFAGIPILTVYGVISYVLLSGGDTVKRIEVIRALKISFVFAVFLLISGLVWTGGLKPAWRAAVIQGDSGKLTINRLQNFNRYLNLTISNFDLVYASEELSQRTASGLFYTALVFKRVPEYVPHQGGNQTWSAVGHVLKPRILFPDKARLKSDSELVRRYSGLKVSGDESGTSVGLGYLTEFYIDFGFVGAFISSFLFGVYIGFIIRLWFMICKWPIFVHAAALLAAWSSLNVFDASLVKLVGGLTMQFIVYSIFLIFLQRLAFFRTLLSQQTEIESTRAAPKYRY